MRDPCLLCAILLLILNQAVSSDVKQEHVQTGKDAHLHIQRPDLIHGAYELKWTFNTRINVFKYSFNGHTNITFTNYKGRLTFNVGDGSLLLKNLTKRDSGLYTAIITKDEDKTVTVNVTVQDGVSPVNLTVVSKFPGLDSCNLTVTCCSQNSSVTNTFTCDSNQHCFQAGGESSEVMTSTGLLSVHMSEGYVICNHSNQVSLSKETTPLCQLDSDAVSPVNMTVDPVSSSPESCNLTVKCSTKDSSVTNTFTCDNTPHCSGENVNIMTSTGRLSLYMSDKSVICSHSNQVSWSNDTTPLCQLDSEGSSDSVSLCLVKNVLFIVCLIIMVSAVITVNIMERCQKQD